MFSKLSPQFYLGVVIILVTAMAHGLTPRRRQQLIDELDLWPQTIARWRRWWRDLFSNSLCWRAERGLFMPPIEHDTLPGNLLGRLVLE